MRSNAPYGLSVIALLLFVSILFAGCDDTLHPFKENDRFFFSIYGYIDTSEDIQWIRVVDLQDQTGPSESGINGTVTIEHLESGETITMHDSLFHFASRYSAFNFWTDAGFQHSASYRIKAEREDGASSSVIIDMPSDFRDPHVHQPFIPDALDELTIWEVENLADVAIRFNVYHPDGVAAQPMAVSLLHQVITVGNDQYTVPINRELIGNAVRGMENITIRDCRIFVAKGGSDWLDFSSIDPDLIMLPEGISNVDQGTGYVAGVKSKTIPYAHALCQDE